MTYEQINLKLLDAAVTYKHCDWTYMKGNCEKDSDKIPYILYHEIGNTGKYYRIDIDISVTPEILLSQIHDNFLYFDVSKETMPFLDKNGHGNVVGLPRSMKGCYEVFEGIRDEINHLHLIMHMVYYSEYYREVKKSA